MFLDTANINDIKEAFTFGVLKGVTTNPSILLKEGQKREEIVPEILENSVGTIFVQAAGSTYEEMYNDCKEILSLNNERIALKIPANIPGFKVIKEIKNQSDAPTILATAIFSTDQGMLCGLAGCDYIAPYVNRMSNNNIDPFDVVRKTRKFYDDRGLQTQILAASFKNTNQVVDVFDAGAHTATVSFDILRAMLSKELAATSILGFNMIGMNCCEKQLNKGVIFMQKIAASIMCADQLHLDQELQKLEEADVELLHCDVMDGVFVNNLAMGPYVLEEIKSKTQAFLLISI